MLHEQLARRHRELRELVAFIREAIRGPGWSNSTSNRAAEAKTLALALPVEVQERIASIQRAYGLTDESFATTCRVALLVGLREMERLAPQQRGQERRAQ